MRRLWHLVWWPWQQAVNKARLKGEQSIAKETMATFIYRPRCLRDALHGSPRGPPVLVAAQLTPAAYDMHRHVMTRPKAALHTIL